MGHLNPQTAVRGRSVVDILKESLEDQPLADYHRALEQEADNNSSEQIDIAASDQVRICGTLTST